MDGSVAVRGSVLGRAAAMYSAVKGGVLLRVAVHGTVAMGRVATMYSAVDGGVLLRVPRLGAAKRTTVTIHRTMTVGGFTDNLANRQGAGTGLLSR